MTWKSRIGTLVHNRARIWTSGSSQNEQKLLPVLKKFKLIVIHFVFRYLQMQQIVTKYQITKGYFRFLSYFSEVFLQKILIFFSFSLFNHAYFYSSFCLESSVFSILLFSSNSSSSIATKKKKKDWKNDFKKINKCVLIDCYQIGLKDVSRCEKVIGWFERLVRSREEVSHYRPGAA